MTFGADINPVFAPATRFEYIPVSSAPASMRILAGGGRRNKHRIHVLKLNGTATMRASIFYGDKEARPGDEKDAEAIAEGDNTEKENRKTCITKG